MTMKRPMTSTPQSTPCLIWRGCTLPDGYGQRLWNGKVRRVHRIAWEQAYGPIPPGMLVLHRCDNPPCYRAEHLFLGTYQDNVDDMVRKNRHSHGEKSGHAKLSAEDVSRIRGLRNKLGSEAKIKHLAEMFNVSRKNIRLILAGETWKAELIAEER